jgi:hypothetical protein
VPTASIQRFLLAMILVMAALLCAPQVAPGVVGMSAPETASGDFSVPFGDSVSEIESQPPQRHQVNSSASTTPVLKVARWLSRDPQGESGGLNLYGFVGSDPVKFCDYLP